MKFCLISNKDERSFRLKNQKDNRSTFGVENSLSVIICAFKKIDFLREKLNGNRNILYVDILMGLEIYLFIVLIQFYAVFQK